MLEINGIRLIKHLLHVSTVKIQIKWHGTKRKIRNSITLVEVAKSGAFETRALRGHRRPSTPLCTERR